MSERWNSDEDSDAAGERGGRAAVLERPERLSGDTMLEPEALAPHAEHPRETVIAFPGMGDLDESTAALLDDLLMSFLEEAPRRGFHTLILSCDEDAPFRSVLEKAVERAQLGEELREIRFTTTPRRVDLFVILQRAMGQARGVADALAQRLLAQRTAGALIVAPDNEAGQLFFWALSGFLECEHCEASVEFVQEPPEPGTDRRISARMLHLLGRQAMGGQIE